MTKEEKQLLLQDLSARLSYGVKVCVQGDEFDKFQYPMLITAISKFEDDSLCKVYNSAYTPFGSPKIEDVKPYLRPLSSMTEDEKNELKEYLGAEEVDCTGFGYIEGGTLEDYISSIPYSLCNYVISWLNAHHFDYNELVPKGLAIKAPKGMY